MVKDTLREFTYIILCSSGVKLVDFPIPLPLLEEATVDIGLAAVLLI